MTTAVHKSFELFTLCSFSLTFHFVVDFVSQILVVKTDVVVDFVLQVLVVKTDDVVVDLELQVLVVRT